jgi:hypothetical protein
MHEHPPRRVVADGALEGVRAVLARLGPGELSALEAPEPPNRDGRGHPGELIHIDVK